MNTVFLSLGGNTGDREHLLHKAVDAISDSVGTVDAISAIYETMPWGMRSSNQFLNIVLCLSTLSTPEGLMQQLLSIERRLGRERRSGGYEDRSIDIDILFFNDLVQSGNGLDIPHPRLHTRNFVLLPMSEIAPDHVHPAFNKTIGELLSGSPDISEVRRWKEWTVSG
jgi:2-amino-4-hydroxy-6-hydroxymethyldihydropteridine diphosphokinase